jgi:hypothetical protein
MEIFLVLVVIIIGIAVAAISQGKKPEGKRTPSNPNPLNVVDEKPSNETKEKTGLIKPKRLLTMNEQPTFKKLVEALPEYVVFAQVSFSAILDTTDRATRNRFNRKIADFVVCNKSFIVIGVVELDDSSHNGREEQDAERDAMFNEAGYKVIRYRRMPERDQVRRDFGL